MMKSISESMAGRVGILSLEGMTPSEILDMGEQRGWLYYYLESPGLMPQYFKRTASEIGSLKSFLWRGTMPGLLYMPDSLAPDYFHSYISTYIERDIRIMEDIRSLSDFERFLALMAALTAQEINASHLGREIGISPSTARKWLNLLIYSFQWL